MNELNNSTKNENKNLAVELNENNNKQGDNMKNNNVKLVEIENNVVEVDVAETNHKGKIIGYETTYYCADCGNEIGDNHKYCTECGLQVREVNTSQKTFIGDIEMIKIYTEEEMDIMTDEEFDNLGCIYEETTEEEKETKYENQAQVMIALINTFKIDVRNTDAYKELINEAKRSKKPIDTNTFYDVLYDQLIDWDCPMIDLGKNIKIECVVEDASFDYDYGSISSTHHCYIPMGYNIIIEDIE